MALGFDSWKIIRRVTQLILSEGSVLHNNASLAEKYVNLFPINFFSPINKIKKL